jgi:hypothetical protein
MLGGRAPHTNLLLKHRLRGRRAISLTRNRPADWWYCFQCVADGAGGHLCNDGVHPGTPACTWDVAFESSALPHSGLAYAAGSCGLRHPQITVRSGQSPAVVPPPQLRCVTLQRRRTQVMMTALPIDQKHANFASGQHFFGWHHLIAADQTLGQTWLAGAALWQERPRGVWQSFGPQTYACASNSSVSDS